MERKSLYGDSQSSPSRLWDDDEVDGIGPSRSPATPTAITAPRTRKRIIGLSKSRPDRQPAVPSSDLNRPRTSGRKGGQEKAESREGHDTPRTVQVGVERIMGKALKSNLAKKDACAARFETKKQSPTVVEALAPFPLSSSDDELDLTDKTLDEDIQLEADLRKARRAKLSGGFAKGVNIKDRVAPLVPTEGKIANPRRGRRKSTKPKSPSPVAEESNRERKDSPDPLALAEDEVCDTWHLSPSRSLSPANLESFPLSHSSSRLPSRSVSPASSAAPSVIFCEAQDDFAEPFPLSPQKSTPRHQTTTKDLSPPSGRKGHDLGGSPEWARRRESSIVDLSDSTPKRNLRSHCLPPISQSGNQAEHGDPVKSGLKASSRSRGKKRKSADLTEVVDLVSEDDSDSALAGPSTPIPRSLKGTIRGNAARSIDLTNLSLQGDPDTYHATWLCKYCGRYMPVHMSEDLQARYHELKELSLRAEVNQSDPLGWQQTLDFCAAHEAEATIVPKGIKAGYPSEIDFSRIVERIEAPWLRQRLMTIARNPGRSRLFRRAEEDVRQIGRLAWRGAAHQQTDRVRSSTRAGYYGELGRTIILQHLQRLLEWRCFPALLPGKDGSPPACAPLQPNDFFIHVLVPEAAILLIMEDQHRDESMPPIDFAAAKTAAKRLWRESTEYGVWKFREDDEEGERIIRQLQDDTEDIERMAREGRAADLAEKRKKKQRATAAIQADRQNDQPDRRDATVQQKQHADTIVISDTASQSAFSDTSADTLELDAIGKDEVLESPLRFKHLVRAACSQDATPRAAQASQASSTFGDEFGEEAFMLLDEAQAMHSKRRKS